MNIQLIQIPYDSGHKDIRAGRGPEHFLQHGLDQILRDAGHQVAVRRIESQAALTTEIGTAFELNRLLAGQVRSAIEQKILPIVLAGNCNSCLGTLAGIDRAPTGIVWFDAHGDFNTPETTLSGFFDGMGLSIATGRCWQTLAQTIPGFQPVAEANVLHLGARDLDAEEAKLFEQSEIQVIRPGKEQINFRKAAETALDQLSTKVSGVYLHVDMDVLDVGEAQPNRLAVPGGLKVEFMEELIEMIKSRVKLSAAAITSFEPDYDKNDQVVEAGIRIAKAFAA